MSLNGSPLLHAPMTAAKAQATVLSKKRANASESAESSDLASSIVVESEGGDGFINLNDDETLDALANNPEMKAQVHEKLQSLQSEVAALLSKIR